MRCQRFTGRSFEKNSCGFSPLTMDSRRAVSDLSGSCRLGKKNSVLRESPIPRRKSDWWTIMVGCFTGGGGRNYLRGEHQMLCYWDMPEETCKTIRDGWLYTGNLGVMTKKGTSTLWRQRDMIISGGQNIYPAEDRAILLRHPNIAEAAVIGIPDRESGEAVLPLSVLKDGSSMTEEEVTAYIKVSLSLDIASLVMEDSQSGCQEQRQREKFKKNN